MLNDDPNLFEQAGDYNLEVCNIISYRRNDTDGVNHQVNIKPIINELTITEDVLSNGILGTIVVFDAQDIRTMTPITGYEKLELKFNTPGFPGLNAVREEGHPFQIYKIERTKVDDTNALAQTYTIHFCSTELYYSSITRVSQAYEGPLEFAVDDILRSTDYLRTKKKFFFEPTKTNTKVVIPNIKPLNAVHMLSQMSQSQKYENAGYLFYENFDGYHFRSIESMIAVDNARPRPAVYDYNYQVSRGGEPDNRANPNTKLQNPFEDLKNIIEYSFDRPVNTLYNLNEGVYASKLVLHDMFYKTIKEYDFDYSADFEKHYHLETDDLDKASLKGILPLAPFEDTRQRLTEYANAKLMTMCDNQKVHNNFEFPPLKDIVQQSISQKLNLSNLHLSMRVYGNSYLRAGDVVNVNLPFQRPLIESQERQEHPYYSGRYLILAIRHELNVMKKNYTMNIRATKDSVVNEFPTEPRPFTLEQKNYSQQIKSIYDIDAGISINDTGRLLGGI